MDPDTGIPLSARELAVLDLMASGLIAAAIARRLGISPRTVSKHIESIYRKLGTHDRTTAVLSAQARGLFRHGTDDGPVAPPEHFAEVPKPRSSAEPVIVGLAPSFRQAARRRRS
jgi:DNA-binding CsgD family transcriptional regulator